MKCIVVEFIRKCYTLTGSKALRGIQYIFIKSKYSILILQFLLFQYVPVHAQFKVKNLLKKAEKVSLPEISLFKQQEPITTSFKDVDATGSLDPSFGNNEKYLPFDTLDFCPDGFVLQPGFFEATLQSFCIRAGTPSPTKGDGYMNAPLQGPMAEIVNHILWNYPFYPKVTQREVQVLLWTIIAKTPYDDYSNGAKETVNILLSANDIKKLKKAGTQAEIRDEIFNSEIIKMPKGLQAILKAENGIRKLAKNGSNDYAAYERMAIAGGIVPDNKQVVSKGRWTYIKDKNYYIRYFPKGYKEIWVQLYVPERKSLIQTGHGPFIQDLFDFPDKPLCYDPSAEILMPSEDMQRLISTQGYFMIDRDCKDNYDDIYPISGPMGRGWTKFKKMIGGAKYEVTTERACACVRG
jgi:hypothetical protein